MRHVSVARHRVLVHFFVRSSTSGLTLSRVSCESHIANRLYTDRVGEFFLSTSFTLSTPKSFMHACVLQRNLAERRVIVIAILAFHC